MTWKLIDLESADGRIRRKLKNAGLSLLSLWEHPKSKTYKTLVQHWRGFKQFTVWVYNPKTNQYHPTASAQHRYGKRMEKAKLYWASKA